MYVDATESAAPADAAAYDCLAVPGLQGWPRLQAQLVDRIKRAALRQLHASAAGERLLLRTYLIGEEATEIALQRDLITQRPDWLVRQMDRHLAEEQQHAQRFAAALAERVPASASSRRGVPHAGMTQGNSPAAQSQPDFLSRRKIATWQRLAHTYAPRFEQGMLVPAFAIGLCAEQMATRVLDRHCSTISTRHTLHPLLSSVLADEARHVRLCSRTLMRLAAPSEQATLAELLEKIRAVDRSWGITSAVAMLLAGCVLRIGSRPA
ncbi:hypothetical protein HSX11_11375 [Oxalobacteraceae bacterium]|nr:hypothetical protein [Oxalobacteraceae bacterium]